MPLKFGTTVHCVQFLFQQLRFGDDLVGSGIFKTPNKVWELGCMSKEALV